MSYPAILPTLAAFAPPRPAPASAKGSRAPAAPLPPAAPQLPAGSSSGPSGSAQPVPRPAPAPSLPALRPGWADRWTLPAPGHLFEALKLAVREAVHAGLGERLDSYSACRWCTARAAWCGDGLPGAQERGTSLEALRMILSADGLAACRPALTLGAKADPYPRSEAALGLTRRLLETLAGFPAGRPRTASSFGSGPGFASRFDSGRASRFDSGFGSRFNPETAETGRPGIALTILTRSPLLLRDLDLLAELDQRHALRVGVVIGAADAAVARRVEPQRGAAKAERGASPAERFSLVRELADRGIATSVICAPIVPGFNNSAAALGRLLDRAAAAGAADVVPAPRHPALPPTPFESRHLLPLFQRLRLEHGFPRALPGRG